MDISVKHFAEFTAEELYEILKLRVDVFVVEQKCPYPELDGRDQDAWHVSLREEGRLLAYLRVLPRSGGEAAIGRVLAVERRRGLGTRVVEEGIRVAREKLGAKRIYLEAQTYARGLYEKLGFRQSGAEFLEDGIPHIPMELM